MEKYTANNGYLYETVGKIKIRIANFNPYYVKSEAVQKAADIATALNQSGVLAHL